MPKNLREMRVFTLTPAPLQKERGCDSTPDDGELVHGGDDDGFAEGGEQVVDGGGVVVQDPVLEADGVGVEELEERLAVGLPV